MGKRALGVMTLVAATALLGPLQAAPAQNKTRPLTVKDLFQFKRLSDPQISPDGKSVSVKRVIKR